MSEPPQPPHKPVGSDVVGRTAMGTVTVLLVLFGIFCVLPALICGFLAAIGSLGG